MIRDAEASDDASTEEEQNQKPEDSAEPTLEEEKENNKINLNFTSNTSSDKAPKKVDEKLEEVQVVQSIRVQVDKLDKLQNLVGETVINRARLMRLSEEIAAIDENLGEMVLQFVEDNETSVRELQDQIQQVRMIEMGGIFTPMKRIVRVLQSKTTRRSILISIVPTRNLTKP